MHEQNLQDKANELSTKTCFRREYLAGCTIEYHKHPLTKEVIVCEWRIVPNGECISQEFQVVGVVPSNAEHELIESN